VGDGAGGMRRRGRPQQGERERDRQRHQLQRKCRSPDAHARPRRHAFRM